MKKLLTTLLLSAGMALSPLSSLHAQDIELPNVSPGKPELPNISRDKFVSGAIGWYKGVYVAIGAYDLDGDEWPEVRVMYEILEERDFFTLGDIIAYAVDTNKNYRIDENEIVELPEKIKKRDNSPKSYLIFSPLFSTTSYLLSNFFCFASRSVPSTTNPKPAINQNQSEEKSTSPNIFTMAENAMRNPTQMRSL